MGKCEICEELYPPDFTIVVDVDVEGKEFFKCVYCESEKDTLLYDTGGGNRDYSKKECVEDYKQLLNKLKESENIKKILDKKEVK